MLSELQILAPAEFGVSRAYANINEAVKTDNIIEDIFWKEKNRKDGMRLIKADRDHLTSTQGTSRQQIQKSLLLQVPTTYVHGSCSLTLLRQIFSTIV